MEKGNLPLRLFNIDLKKVLLVGFVIVLPLLAINMQRAPGELPWYLRVSGLVTGRLQTSYMDFSSGVRGTTALYLDLIGIKRQNRELKKQNTELRAQLNGLEELRLENERLNKLLDFRQKTKMQLVAAKVIGRDLVADHETIEINRGREQGLKPGLAVITVEGAVGYIFRIEETSASVLVLTDRYAVIDAIVQRTRARGLVEGKSHNSCSLLYLERAQDVAVGDIIVTSGLAKFPKGFPIAKVTSVAEDKYGISQKVDLEPIVNPNNVEEVFVILNPANEDFTPQPAASTTEEQAS